MTIERAIKLSIKKWEIIARNPWEFPFMESRLKKYIFSCPLCTVFLKKAVNYYYHAQINERDCPLFTLRTCPSIQLCHPDYHAFVSCFLSGNIEGAKMYASRILHRLQEALVCS